MKHPKIMINFTKYIIFLYESLKTNYDCHFVFDNHNAQEQNHMLSYKVETEKTNIVVYTLHCYYLPWDGEEHGGPILPQSQ